MDPYELADVSTALLDEAGAQSAPGRAHADRWQWARAAPDRHSALLEGSSLSDHESPGEATLQVLVGRVRLSWSDEAVDLGTGGFVVIPRERHGLLALTDAVVLLTTAMS